MSSPRYYRALFACIFVALPFGPLQSPAQAGGTIGFTGHVPDRNSRYFYPIKDIAVRSGRESGFRIRVSNRSGRTERLHLDIATASGQANYQLIGFTPTLEPKTQVNFIIVFQHQRDAGNANYRVCMERRTSRGRTSAGECIRLRSIAIR